MDLGGFDRLLLSWIEDVLDFLSAIVEILDKGVLKLVFDFYHDLEVT